MIKKVVIFCLVFLLCFGCERPPRQFDVGQLVISKVSPRLNGQIIDIEWKIGGKVRYRVRWAMTTEKTDVSLFGEDGSIKTRGFSCLWMWEYELEAVKG